MTLQRTLFLLTSITLLATLASCVSYRKYEDTLLDRDRLYARVNLQSDSLTRFQDQTRRANESTLSLEERNRLLKDELASARSQYTTLERANTDLLTRYDRVLAQNQAELTASSSEQLRLRSELNQQELALKQKEAELNEVSKQLDQREQDLNRRIATLESDLNSTRTVVAARESELNAKSSEINALRNALAAKDAKLAALRDRVRGALTSFSASDLSVQERAGKIYVSLSQNLLFASGSKQVGQAGREALAQVAKVIAASPDIAITVEGHTDTDGSPSMNWALSTARATSVAQHLIDGGVDPQRLTAAGRGQYQPLADNGSAEGKARNRRTEIILTPQLGELYELVVGSGQ